MSFLNPLMKSVIVMAFLILFFVGGNQVVLAAGSTINEVNGDKAFAQGDYKKAAKEYKNAVAKDPGNAALHFKLAQAYFKKGEMDEAMAEFIRTTNINPRHEGAFQYLGDFFEMKKETEKSAKAYASLVEINPNSAKYHLQYARVCEKLLKNDEALLHYYKTILINAAIEDAYPPLFNLLKTKIALAPYDPDPHLVIGRVYKLHREMGEAKNQFALVTQFQPQARDGWEELLEVCRLLKDCKGEIGSLEGLLQFSPTSVDLVNQIITAAKGCDMRDVAIAYLEKRIAWEPNRAESYAEVARLYRDEGNRTQAYFYFRKYLDLCPGCANVDEYRRWCENENLADPVMDSRYHSFSLFNTGLASFKGGQFTDALDQFQKAKAVFAGFPQLHFFMGQTLEELGRRGEALFAYKEAIKLQPGNAEYWFILGSALNAEKMYDNAVICFRKVLEVDPENKFGYTLRSQKMLQSYMEQGIIKREKILDQVR